MAKLHEIYKCEACGSVVEVIHAASPAPVCCGKTMKVLAENTVDAAKEKHVPVVEKTANGIHVKVGSVTHPMEEKHYIEWIQVITTDGRAYTKFLKPGEKPEADFPITDTQVIVREYCNLHGVWKA